MCSNAVVAFNLQMSQKYMMPLRNVFAACVLMSPWEFSTSLPSSKCQLKD